MIPYTRDALTTIRSEISKGIPPDLVRQQLGWDASMFDRICRQHGIDARASSADAQPTPRHNSPALAPRSTAPPKYVKAAIAMRPDLIAKVEKYAARAGITRYHGAGAIVAEYIATVGASQIQFVTRAPYGEGKDAIVVAVGVEESVWMELFREARRRQTKGATVGALVKASIVRYFEGVPA